MFTLLPAVDVADGRVVRLGEADHESPGEPAPVDPLAAALAWQLGGADWIHLVDLDAAFGRGSNADQLAAVISALDVHVELSGGVGDDGSLARALSTGCERVVLSTAALDDAAWCAKVIETHGERIAVALDVQVIEQGDGMLRQTLAARGGRGAGGDLWETLAELDRVGCARYIVTDVYRDGMLRGPNLELYRAVVGATASPVIASGGISSIDDLVTLAEITAAGACLDGAIVGKALHVGRFTLSEALTAIRESCEYGRPRSED